MSSDLLFRILSGFAVMIITFSVKHRSHCLQMLIVTVAVCLVLILVLLEEECFPTYMFDDTFGFFNWFLDVRVS